MRVRSTFAKDGERTMELLLLIETAEPRDPDPEIGVRDALTRITDPSAGGIGELSLWESERS